MRIPRAKNDVAFAKALHPLLVAESHEVVLTHDGKEAWETLRENRHHLFGSQQGKATDTTISPANSTRRRPQIQMS